MKSDVEYIDENKKGFTLKKLSENKKEKELKDLRKRRNFKLL